MPASSGNSSSLWQTLTYSSTEWPATLTKTAKSGSPGLADLLDQAADLGDLVAAEGVQADVGQADGVEHASRGLDRAGRGVALARVQGDRLGEQPANAAEVQQVGVLRCHSRRCPRPAARAWPGGPGRSGRRGRVGPVALHLSGCHSYQYPSCTGSVPKTKLPVIIGILGALAEAAEDGLGRTTCRRPSWRGGCC